MNLLFPTKNIVLNLGETITFDQVTGKLDASRIEGDLPAEQSSYDNTESGLEATNVQDAIDELARSTPEDIYTKEESDDKFATKTALEEVSGDIPTKTSDLQNDSGFAEIDDTQASAGKVYSSNKVNVLLGDKADESEVSEIKTITIEKRESKNILDINTLEHGQLQWNGTFAPSTTSDYWCTPYIAVNSGDYVHFITNGVEGEMRTISQYREDKTFISNVANQRTYNITDTAVKYIRIMIYKPLRNIRIMVAITQSSDILPFEWCYKPYTKVAGTRLRVDVNSTDGITTFWDKMQEAFYKGDCDVFIHKGEYVYTNELIDYIRSLNRRGVPIGNGCHYYFETGANITCEYTGENVEDVKGYFTPLDSWSIASDYEIYNLSLSSKNTIYAIHDEANGEETPIKRVYKNCYVSLDNSVLGEQSSALSKCIGGGFGLHSEIIIENCVFNTINPNTEHGEDVSYHKANDQTYTDAKVIVSGCYFGGAFRCDMNYSPIPSIVPRVIACGNSALGINAYQCELKAWNNEIRT